MSIKKIVQTNYKDEDRGFEYTFEPVEDSLTIEEGPEEFTARYLTNDDMVEGPQEDQDENLFLVHYHRSFYVESKIVKEEDIRTWYHEGKSGIEKDFWVLPVTSYIHSGVSLYLGMHSNPSGVGYGHFDTSHVGAVLASKKEFKTQKQAEKAAGSLIKTWNEYLSGDVWCIVKETYDKEKVPLDYDIVGGYYGYDYALGALKTDI